MLAEPSFARNSEHPASARHDVTRGTDGIIRVTIRGLWNRGEVDGFFRTLEPIHSAARRDGAVRALIAVETV